MTGFSYSRLSHKHRMYPTKQVGQVRLAQRLKNLSKGDRIVDAAFNPYANGVTRFSLAAWETVKKHVDISLITKAQMTFSEKDWFALTLTHKNGYKFVFLGVSSGYHGEGSRGTEKILTDIGFNNVNRIFLNGNENWTMKRTTVEGGCRNV